MLYSAPGAALLRQVAQVRPLTNLLADPDHSSAYLQELADTSLHHWRAAAAEFVPGWQGQHRGTLNCLKISGAACLQELANASHTTGLLLRLLLCQAEQGGIQLEADTANLENEFLLQQVAGSEASALAKPASAFARRPHALKKIGAQTVRTGGPRGEAAGPVAAPCAVHHMQPCTQETFAQRDCVTEAEWAKSSSSMLSVSRCSKRLAARPRLWPGQHVAFVGRDPHALARMGPQVACRHSHAACCVLCPMPAKYRGQPWQNWSTAGEWLWLQQALPLWLFCCTQMASPALAVRRDLCPSGCTAAPLHQMLWQPVCRRSVPVECQDHARPGSPLASPMGSSLM